MATESSGLSSIEAVEPRSSFSLAASGMAWFVRSGTLDVFATRSIAGNDAAALTPLFQVSVGQAAFGVPEIDAVPIGLLAKRSQGSDVVAVPGAGFVGAASPGGVTGTPDPLAEWIAALSRAAAGDLMPREVEWLDPGARVAIDADSRLFASKRPLVWIRQTAGRSRFLGRADAVITAGTAAYPLSMGAWIEAEPGSTFSVVDDAPAAELAGGLTAFYGHALGCIARNLDAADQRERQRFRSRAEADGRAVQAALTDLASPLTRAADRPAAEGLEALDTVLMRACRAVGERLGVTIRPHPDILQGRPVKSPVDSIAQASGIRARRVALKDRWLTNGSEPLLVFRNADERPAALLPRRWGGYSIYDPELGTTTPLDPATAAALNPFAFMFYRPFAQKTLSVRDVLAFGLEGSRRELVLIVVVSAAAALLALLLPYLTQLMYDSVIPNAQRSDLATVTALLVVAAFVTALFNVARGYAVLRLQGRLSLALQGALWDRLLSLPLPFFREYAAGDLAQRSMAFAQIRTLLSGTTLTAVLSGIFSIFSFGLLFYYSWRLALIALLMTLLALVFVVTAGSLQVGLQRQIFARIGHIAGRVVEFISGIAKFRIAGAERRAFVLWVKEFAQQKRVDFRARRISTVVAVFNSIYIVTCTGVLFFVNSGVPAWRSETLSTGEFLAFVAAFGQFMSAALAMGWALVGMTNVVPLYERALPILQGLPEVLPTQTVPRELKGEVEGQHLIFRYYPDAPLVLRDVSFHIAPGEYAAFVGPSGCGKSTLFRLLLGFETPVSGSVYYDGVDLAGLDAQAIRRQIGVVLQSGTLLAGSLWENICGAAWFPLEDAWEAARMAGLEEDIKNMAMGMHTVVQAGGGGLSGGQRQRLLIARALVGKPRLLLFDEATSSLDNRTQAIVSQSLAALNATRIVIAHRLSTVIGADRIIVMDRGQIVQTGNYAELMRAPGLFRELAERQLT
jgi:NHLM bacteriocin system ABC transporter ATP-binding protein